MNNNTAIVAIVAILASTLIRRTERGIIDLLEGAGAVTPETATTLNISGGLKGMLFRRLLQGGAVGETAQQTQYLNVVGYAQYRRRRQIRGLVAALAVVALGVGYYFLTSKAP